MKPHEIDVLRLWANAEADRQKTVLQDANKTLQDLFAELSELEKLARQPIGGVAGHGEMSSIGAEKAWKSWVERRRIELQTKLSAATAQRNIQQEALGMAIGRREAVQVLQKNAWAREKQTNKRHQQEVLLAVSLIFDSITGSKA